MENWRALEKLLNSMSDDIKALQDDTREALVERAGQREKLLNLRDKIETVEKDVSDFKAEILKMLGDNKKTFWGIMIALFSGAAIASGKIDYNAFLAKIFGK